MLNKAVLLIIKCMLDKEIFTRETSCVCVCAYIQGAPGIK